MDRAAVFIDGGYLRRVLKDVFGEPRIDYEKFSNVLCGNEVERMRTYYYDCMPLLGQNPTKEERERYAGMQRFIDYLRKLKRFEVRLGKLIYIPERGKPIQKRIDVLLSVDLVRMSWDKQIQRAILVTGDSDFVPAVKAAKDAGVLTIVYYSRGAPTVYAHDELLDACDERYEITEELIRSVTVKKPK